MQGLFDSQSIFVESVSLHEREICIDTNDVSYPTFNYYKLTMVMSSI